MHVLTSFPLNGGCSEGPDAFRFVFIDYVVYSTVTTVLWFFLPYARNIYYVVDFCLSILFSFCLSFVSWFVFCTSLPGGDVLRRLLFSRPLPYSVSFPYSCLYFIFLRPRSRFGLIWFRLSGDYGWIRNGSFFNDVRQTTRTTT